MMYVDCLYLYVVWLMCTVGLQESHGKKISKIAVSY